MRWVGFAGRGRESDANRRRSIHPIPFPARDRRTTTTTARAREHALLLLAHGLARDVHLPRVSSSSRHDDDVRARAWRRAWSVVDVDSNCVPRAAFENRNRARYEHRPDWFSYETTPEKYTSTNPDPASTSPSCEQNLGSSCGGVSLRERAAQPARAVAVITSR